MASSCGGEAVVQADSVTCSLVMTGVHRCDVSGVLRNTRWADWYQDASPMHDDDCDNELIVTLSAKTLQEVTELLQLTSKIKCSLGRQLCFVARSEDKSAHLSVCDSGHGWQDLSGSFYGG